MAAASQYVPTQAIIQPQDIRWTWQESHTAMAHVKREPDHPQSLSTYSPRPNIRTQTNDASTTSIGAGQHVNFYTHHVQNRPPPVFVNGIPSPYSDLFSGTSTSFECVSPGQSHLTLNNTHQNAPNNYYIAPELDDNQQHNDPVITASRWDSHLYESNLAEMSQDRNHSSHSQQLDTSEWHNIQRLPRFKSASPTIIKPTTMPSSTLPSTMPFRPKTLRRSRTESVTTADRNTRSWKAAHNLVERNYRDRLNDQIAELSNILFECPDENVKGSKPPKSLVISRAKERIRELAFQNEKLLDQVDKLRQHIAVLDHVARASGSGNGGVASELTE